MQKAITFIGLDVHKDSIVVSLAEAGLRGRLREVRAYGKILNTPAALKAMTTKLAAGGNELRFCYEAGPCGYGVQRQLSGMGHQCAVVAPSLVPRRPGERIKTDRRDANNLARLHRAGELTPVWVPDPAHEAIRDLVRARGAAVRSLRRARQQLFGFLLRNGHHYHRTPWTAPHRHWLASLKFEQAVHYTVLEDSIAAVEAAKERRDCLEAQMRSSCVGCVCATAGARTVSAAQEARTARRCGDMALDPLRRLSAAGGRHGAEPVGRGRSYDHALQRPVGRNPGQGRGHRWRKRPLR